MAFGTVLWILGIVCAIWVIYDVWAVNKKDDTAIKILWTILALIFSIVAAIIYYFVRKR